MVAANNGGKVEIEKNRLSCGQKSKKKVQKSLFDMYIDGGSLFSSKNVKINFFLKSHFLS